MNMYMKSALAGLAIAAMSTSANARCSPGEIANLLCESGIVSEADANNLDRAHAAMGKPLDRVAERFIPRVGMMPRVGSLVSDGAAQRFRKNRKRMRLRACR